MGSVSDGDEVVGKLLDHSGAVAGLNASLVHGDDHSLGRLHNHTAGIGALSASEMSEGCVCMQHAVNGNTSHAVTDKYKCNPTGLCRYSWKLNHGD